MEYISKNQQDQRPSRNPDKRARNEGQRLRMDRAVDSVQAKEKKEGSTNGALPKVVQQKMENAFDTDFSSVDIKTNSSEAKNMGALAFTQGENIHFAPGQYDPNSSKGQELLGHELTHVVQQRQGRVQAKPQAKGLAVNDDPALEAEADEMGKKAAEGQKVSDISSVQDNNPQLKRLLPSGGVQRIEINTNEVINAFEDLWGVRPASYRSNWEFDTPAKFSDHPSLPSMVRSVCGGSLFYNKNTWNSGWVDDGDTDILWAGDADILAEIDVYVDNEKQKGSGTVSNNASGQYSTSNQRSSSTTYSGKATAGVEKGGGKAGVETGVSHTEGQTNTDTSSGSISTTMDLNTKLIVGDLVMVIRLKFRPSIGGPPGQKSCELETSNVGKVLFDSPF